MKIKLSPYIFFKVLDGKLVVWNYKNHTQFEIEPEYMSQILAISEDGTLPESSDVEIIKDLLDAEILTSDMASPTWGWDYLSHIFHFGTQHVLNTEADLPTEAKYDEYMSYCGDILDKVPEIYTERSGRVVKLDRPETSTLEAHSLWNVLNGRKTGRTFFREHLTLSQVSTLLYATFGAIHGLGRPDIEAAGAETVGYRRSSPSGGSLHASEAYVVALRVNDLEPGIYHYRSHTHELSLVNDAFDASKLGALLCAQMFANDLSLGVFITSRFDKLWWKYPHSRAYRVALLDIGCLIQTFQLTSTAMGLESWPTGYFFDSEINKILKIDENKESVLFFMGAGRGSASPFCEEELETMNRMREMNP